MVCERRMSVARKRCGGVVVGAYRLGWKAIPFARELLLSNYSLTYCQRGCPSNRHARAGPDHRVELTLVSMPEEAMLGGDVEAWSFTSTQEQIGGKLRLTVVQKAMRWPQPLEYVLNELECVRYP